MNFITNQKLYMKRIFGGGTFYVNLKEEPYSHQGYYNLKLHLFELEIFCYM